jgi:hypothetical protein
LGTVAQVLGDYFRLHGERGEEHWFPLPTTSADGGWATLPFGRDEFAAHSVQPPDAYDESEYIGPSLLNDEQREQRELVLRELSEQRERLRRAETVSSAEARVGIPVEEELEQLERRAVTSSPTTRKSRQTPTSAAVRLTIPSGARLLRAALLAQACYYVITGIWGNVHRSSFEAVSGKKQDYWLVRCVGLLVLVIGVFIGRAAVKPRVADDVVGVAMSSAVGLGLIEGYFGWKNRISRIYVGDAVAEAVFAGLTLLGWRRAKFERAG